MTPEELDRLLRALNRLRPFRHFVIELNSGREITVTHPETVSRLDVFYCHTAPDNVRRYFKAGAVTSVAVLPPG